MSKARSPPGGGDFDPNTNLDERFSFDLVSRKKPQFQVEYYRRQEQLKNRKLMRKRNNYQSIDSEA